MSDQYLNRIYSATNNYIEYDISEVTRILHLHELVSSLSSVLWSFFNVKLSFTYFNLHVPYYCLCASELVLIISGLYNHISRVDHSIT